mgnify:CR=1 FL=1
MSYLVSAYTMANDLGKAEDVLNRMVEMEPDHIATRLTRVNLLFMLDKDAEVITDCLHVIELEPSNHVAYFMMAKAKKATNDVFGAIADLTRSIALKEDFADAYLLRAEILLGLGQAKEALPDVEKAIEIVPEVGSCRRMMVRAIVVLPHPDGPRRQAICPASRRKLTPSTTVCFP